MNKRTDGGSGNARHGVPGKGEMQQAVAPRQSRLEIGWDPLERWRRGEELWRRRQRDRGRRLIVAGRERRFGVILEAVALGYWRQAEGLQLVVSY